jgi:transposase InsO family protein
VILAEYDALDEPGAKGALLRREGLSAAERGEILRVLTSPRFCDKSVAHTWAVLLDEGVYLASRSTMHRLLRAQGLAGERRRQARHPARVKPELHATAPGQVWSWDIVRHEALPNRAAMEGRRHRLVAASRP